MDRPTKSIHSVIIPLLLAISIPYPSRAQSLPSSTYIRNTKADRIIVFVHGFLGDSVSTWTNGQSYWPKMIVNDHYFDGADVFVYQYQTSIDADLTPDQVADDMRVVLKSNGVSDRKELIFLSHSMGGVITRAYLLKYRDIAAKTAFLQFYATPTDGSSVATIASLASRIGHLGNAQIDRLKSNIEKDYLGDQTRDWQSARFNIPSYCAYEEQSTYGIKVVSFESATALCNSPPDAVDTNYIDIVKPLDEQSQSYLIFKANFKDAFDRLMRQGQSTSSVVRNESGGQ